MHTFEESEKRRRAFVTVKRLTACPVPNAVDLINLLIRHLEVSPTDWNCASIEVTKQLRGMPDPTGELIYAILPFVTGAGDICGGGGPVSGRRAL